MTVRLCNVNAYGRMDLPVLGLTLDLNEEFDVEDDLLAAALLEQVGNYESVEE